MKQDKPPKGLKSCMCTLRKENQALKSSQIPFFLAPNPQLPTTKPYLQARRLCGWKIRRDKTLGIPVSSQTPSGPPAVSPLSAAAAHPALLDAASERCAGRKARTTARGHLPRLTRPGGSSAGLSARGALRTLCCSNDGGGQQRALLPLGCRAVFIPGSPSLGTHVTRSPRDFLLNIYLTASSPFACV